MNPPPPHRYTRFREKAPQKAGTYTYTMSMWEPPTPRDWLKPGDKKKLRKPNPKKLYFRMQFLHDTQCHMDSHH